MARSRTTVLLVVGSACFLAAGLLVWRWLAAAGAEGERTAVTLGAAAVEPGPRSPQTAARAATTETKTASEAGAAPARPPVTALEKPPPRPDDYVGSQACAGCHAAIAESFARHPMGQAMDTVPGANPVEARTEARAFTDREREYVVEDRDGIVFHHERVTAPDGTPIYDQAMPVRFAIGSGTRGRSYLIEHDGLLFQSPIGWYTGTGRYGLSPGYEHDRGLRFERAVGDGCLHCHAGLVEHAADGSDRYSSRVFAEAAIGCERCHGPGAEHVATMSALPAGAKADDLRIVNPVDLEPRRREAVCNQCHLGGEAVIPRFGRGFYDFRPGDHLDDTLLLFVHDEKTASASGAKPVSQVEQMRQSGCWKGTGGTLGCVSCHDPHSKPAPEAMDAFYRTKCQACHEEKPCSLPNVEREALPAAGSCIHCHMPSQKLEEIAHTAMSDHRVPRRPDDAPPAAPRGGPESLVAFDDAAERVPARELKRARGLALASLPGTTKSTRRAQEAISALTPTGVDGKDQRALVAALAGDVEALRGLGQLFASTGRMDAAAACWEGALAADPADAETMSMLSLQMQRGGRLRESLVMLDRIVATNPSVAAIHAQRGTLLVSLGRPDEAIAAARKSLELDPSSLSVRSFLAELLARTNRSAEAEEERATISRLKAAAAAPYRPSAAARPDAAGSEGE